MKEFVEDMLVDSVEGVRLQYTVTAKSLGVTIDINLNINLHIDKLILLQRAIINLKLI